MDKTLTKRMVPANVSMKKAPESEAWNAPTLKDFTDKTWDELTAKEKRHIAGHYAWAKSDPPETFGDLKLPHHDPKTGSVNWHGVANAAARLDQADIPSEDVAGVKAHLRRHYKQFGKDIPDNLKEKEEKSIAKDEETGSDIMTGMSPVINDEADNEMYRSYFERKQPANKASTKVLERYFKRSGMELPENEADAWKQMGDHMDDMMDHMDELKESHDDMSEKLEEAHQKISDLEGKVTEMSKLVETYAAKPAEDEEDKADGGADEDKENESANPHNNVENDPTDPNNVENEDRSIQSSKRAGEAPSSVRTDSVQLPLQAVVLLTRGIQLAATEAAAEALRQGKSTKHVDEIFKTMEQKFLGDISNHS